MEIYVSKKPVTLTPRDVIGSGGEATVFAKGGYAYKIYHKTTARRAHKLTALLAIASNFPAEVLAPKELVTDKSGKVVGYAMPLAPKDAEVIKALANKSYRAANSLGTKEVAEILLAAGKTLNRLHPQNVVVGDLNDLNELFAGGKVYFVDSDSFQFGKYKCEVATEDYLCPSLYDLDLGKLGGFTPATDWYSYAVLLFRSLLLVHPYGGVYPGLPTIADRAKGRITVLDPKVRYPRLGANPAILTDELLDHFGRIFKDGQYGIFPVDLLEDYVDQLIRCTKCGEFYPASRGVCPVCSAPAVIPIATKTGRFAEKVLFATAGPIIFSKVTAQVIYAVAYEEGLVCLYRWQAGRTERHELFASARNLVFELAMRKLAVGRKGSRKVALIDPESGEIQQTETSLFNEWPVLTGTEKYLYRLTGGLLLRAEPLGSEILDHTVTTVMPEQTWVCADATSGLERIVMVTRIFERWHYQLVVGGKCFDLPVSELEEAEKLIELKVKFEEGSFILLRQTKKNGKNYLRLDLVDKSGKLLKSHKRLYNESKHGQIWHAAFSGDSLLYYSGDSLIRESLTGTKITKFDDPGSLLMGTESLYPWRGKLLAIGERKVALIEKGV